MIHETAEFTPKKERVCNFVRMWTVHVQQVESQKTFIPVETCGGRWMI